MAPSTLRRALVAALACSALLPASAAAWLPGSPPGANDPDCRPSAERPVPVVLVHATFASDDEFYTLAPALRARGFCVFALDYGQNGRGDIRDSAAELGRFVDEVLATTGAAKVSLVGHSQGGMMPRWWMRFLDGAGKVDDLVGFAPPNHGTTLAYWDTRGWCVACEQQRAGSDFMRELNEGGDTLPGPSYTVVSTRYDLVATPYTSQALDGPPEQVTNVVLQDACPADFSEHVTIVGDPVAWAWMFSALERPGPADPALRPCL